MLLGRSLHTLVICLYVHQIIDPKISRPSWSEVITWQGFKLYAIDPAHTEEIIKFYICSLFRTIKQTVEYGRPVDDFIGMTAIPLSVSLPLYLHPECEFTFMLTSSYPSVYTIILIYIQFS